MHNIIVLINHDTVLDKPETENNIFSNIVRGVYIPRVFVKYRYYVILQTIIKAYICLLYTSNHLIRREAGEDAAYVEETCRQLGVSFYLTEVDVEALAKSRGLSVEEAGRQVRYRAFYEAAESFGADRIAVAHNRNDRAETLLFRCV